MWGQGSIKLKRNSRKLKVIPIRLLRVNQKILIELVNHPHRLLRFWYVQLALEENRQSISQKAKHPTSLLLSTHILHSLLILDQQRSQYSPVIPFEECQQLKWESQEDFSEADSRLLLGDTGGDDCTGGKTEAAKANHQGNAFE